MILYYFLESMLLVLVLLLLLLLLPLLLLVLPLMLLLLLVLSLLYLLTVWLERAPVNVHIGAQVHESVWNFYYGCCLEGDV